MKLASHCEAAQTAIPDSLAVIDNIPERLA